MRVSTFGGYCNEIELATRQGRQLAVQGLPGENKNSNPLDPQDSSELGDNVFSDPGVRQMYGTSVGTILGSGGGLFAGAALARSTGIPLLGLAGVLLGAGVGGYLGHKIAS